MKATKLRQVIQWQLWQDPKYVNTRSMDFLGAFEWSPPDADSMSKDEQLDLRFLTNQAIKTFSSGWCTWFLMKKTATKEYPRSVFPDFASQAVDDECRARFEAARTQYDTRFYVAPQYTPPLNINQRLSALFGSNTGANEEMSLDYYAERFEEGMKRFVSDLGSFAISTERLEKNALATFLKGLVNRDQSPVRAPEFPAFIHDYFCSDDLLPGFSPAIGTFTPDPDGGYLVNGQPVDASHMRILKVTAEPAFTFPAMLRRLGSINGEFTVSAKWMPFDDADGAREIRKRREAWASNMESWWHGLFKKSELAKSKEIDLDSGSRADQCNAMLAQLQSRDSTVGLWSLTVTAIDKDARALDGMVKEIQSICSGLEITATVIRDNVVDAFLAGVPGHALSMLDRLLASSQKFADFLPTSAKWSGPRRDHHFKAPALMRCAGKDSIPFNVCLHPSPDSDRPHFALIGDSGAGKSSALNKIMMQFRRYPDSQIFVIGKKCASKIPVLAMGGVFHNLEPGNRKFSLQPLARADDMKEQPWIFEWILSSLEQEGLAAESDQKDEIMRTIKHLGTLPIEQRTISDFRNFVQDHEIRKRLGVFCHGGVAGDFLDNEASSVNFADVTGFDTLGLMDNKTAMGPVISCICHEIERRFNGRPTLALIDEAGLEFDFPMLPAAVRRWTKLARWANVTVGLATQSLSDYPPAMALLLSEAVEIRFYTANSRAREKLISNMLLGYGLSEEKIEALSTMRKKREYAMQCPAGWRIYEDEMTGVTFDFCCAGDSQAVLREADEVLERVGIEKFGEAWLEHRRATRLKVAA